jgi:hypothetical protein
MLGQARESRMAFPHRRQADKAARVTRRLTISG